MCTTQSRFLGADSLARPGPKAPLGSSRQGSQTPCLGHLSSPSSATHTHSITTFIVRRACSPPMQKQGVPPFPGAQLLSQASGDGGLAAPSSTHGRGSPKVLPQLLLTPAGVTKSAAQRQAQRLQPRSAFPSHSPPSPPWKPAVSHYQVFLKQIEEYTVLF